MMFRNPEWLALLPLLALAGWYWRRLQLHRPLRALLLLLLVGILMRPQMSIMEQGMDLFVLLDRSESTEGAVERSLPEWEKLLLDSKRRNDRLILVDYAAEPLPQEIAAGQPFTGSRHFTRTAMAVQAALALKEKNRPSRMLVFTDGYSTEPLTGLADRLLSENVPMDVRFLNRTVGDDFRLVRFQTPHRVQTLEPYLLQLQISGPEKYDGPIKLIIHRDGQLLKETEVTMKKGRGLARFTDRMSIAGGHKYEAMIVPNEDTHVGNNRLESWTEVVGGPRLLLVTSYQSDPMAEVLRKMSYEVEVVTRAALLQPGQLTGCRGVILNNVPAHEMPPEFLASMDFFVRQQGGGLLMAGGKHSFGSGGYFRSAIDSLLPVSMELKTDQRKTAVAMSIVLDRSGSMGAQVQGGRIKMDLANEGAAKAIEMLGYQDWVSVFAVDSEAHVPVNMQQVKDDGNKSTLMRICRKISVGGGGIFTYTGLKAGWKVLKSSNYGTRHLILFADAADAEEPGDYIKLLEEMTKAGATVSVIALGTKADADAKFLEDVAARGNGRIFFTNKAEELPNIFTQETMAVARSSFIDDPVAMQETGGWVEITEKNTSWLGEVDGYNLSYKKNWASQALITKDEFSAPLVAWGQRGTGRTAAVSFPLGGEHSTRVRSWNGYGDFIQTIGRWLIGDGLPPGLGIRQEMAGTELQLDLLFEPEWEARLAADAPRVILAEGTRAEIQRELTWRRLSPGHYSVSADLSDGQLVRGVIHAGKHVLPFGPVAVGRNAEWAFDAKRVEELRQTVAISGGREVLDLHSAWESPRTKEFTDIRHWLLLCALGVMLSDALMTRLGRKLPEWATRRDKIVIAKHVKVPKSQPQKYQPQVFPASPTPEPAAAAPVPDTTAEDEAARRRARFARAKGKS